MKCDPKMGLSWSAYSEGRKEFHEKYKRWYNVPVVRNGRKFALKHIGRNCKVLDIGAGDKNFYRLHLKTAGFSGIYKSMDTDKKCKHDYYDLKEIKETFAVVVMFEVVEHMQLKLFLEYLSKIREILKDGGKLIVSTPNALCPIAYLTDMTHIQHYTPHDLYSIFYNFNFSNIRIYRLDDRFFATPIEFIMHSIGKIFRIILNEDYCGGLLAIGTK